MDQKSIDLIAENEREWRQYMIKRVDEINKKFDKVDKELSTFKAKVFTVASVFGGVTGLSVTEIKKFLIGG